MKSSDIPDHVFHWTAESEGAVATMQRSDRYAPAYAHLETVGLRHPGAYMPLLNLGNGWSSVPHSSHVLDASCGFYTVSVNIHEKGP